LNDLNENLTSTDFWSNGNIRLFNFYFPSLLPACRLTEKKAALR
jgi:hypothetical protein